MVKGLDIFREHFRDFSDRYMLIGGVACSLIFEELGIDFRGTRDIDIVLNIAARSRPGRRATALNYIKARGST